MAECACRTRDGWACAGDHFQVCRGTISGSLEIASSVPACDQDDAMYVDFRLPERLQGKLRKGQSALVDLDALPGQRFTAVVMARSST